MVSNKAQPCDAVGLEASSDNPIKGILLMLMAMQIVPAMDGLAKLLSASYPVLQIVWARFFFHFLLLLPIILWRHGWAALFPPQVLIHIVRGGCLLGDGILLPRDQAYSLNRCDNAGFHLPSNSDSLVGATAERVSRHSTLVSSHRRFRGCMYYRSTGLRCVPLGIITSTRNGDFLRVLFTINTQIVGQRPTAHYLGLHCIARDYRHVRGDAIRVGHAESAGYAADGMRRRCSRVRPFLDH